jgi:hypothetical protein
MTAFAPLSSVRKANLERVLRVEWTRSPNPPTMSAICELETLEATVGVGLSHAVSARQPKPGAGRIVAALSFGFWTAMFGPDYEGLWRATLHRIAAKPDGTGLRRKDFSGPLTPIRTIRNRIPHHEPIFPGDHKTISDSVTRMADNWKRLCSDKPTSVRALRDALSRLRTSPQAHAYLVFLDQVRGASKKSSYWCAQYLEICFSRQFRH